MVRQIKPSRLEPKLNRIEEVKKILKRICSPHFEYWFSDIARQICQLFPQPLDDEKLREKIASIKLSFGIGGCIIGEEYAEKIYALLQPKIEEVKARALEAGKLLGARDILDWFFERVRSREELETKLLSLGFSKEYAKWRANT